MATENDKITLTLKPPCGVCTVYRNGTDGNDSLVQLRVDVEHCGAFIQWLVATLEVQLDEQLDRRLAAERRRLVRKNRLH